MGSGPPLTYLENNDSTLVIENFLYGKNSAFILTTMKDSMLTFAVIDTLVDNSGVTV